MIKRPGTVREGLTGDLGVRLGLEGGLGNP